MSSIAPPGLYVHIPFCKTKCPYCDFYSVTDGASVGIFLDALKREAALYADLFPQFDTLYLGGGTPSFLESKALTKLFEALRSHFAFLPETEITIELNPDDVTREKLDLYRELGVNRISLGVQSFNDRELAFLKRRHSARGAKDALDLIGAAGFQNFGIDLMYGLPRQREKSWMKTLKEAFSFGPAHLSCYQLTINDGTPFGKMAGRGDFKVPSEERERRFFLSTSECLSGQGFTHYEISNFARDKTARSRHNLKYWQHAPYLGLGPSAHSYQKGVRWWNVRSVIDYCGALNRNSRPVESQERLTREQIELEELFLGLRNLEGVDKEELRLTTLPESNLTRFISEGLIEVHDGRIVPTVKGYLLADRLPIWLCG